MTVLLVLPVIIVGVLGNVLRFDLKELRFAILDESSGVESGILAADLDKSEQFSFAGYLLCDLDVERAFIEDDVKFVLYFPDKFHLGERLQVFVDGTDLVLGEAIVKALYTTVKGGYSFEYSFIYNEELKSEKVPLPGLVMIALVIVSSVMLGMSINRERESGTARVLVISPLSVGEIVAGKSLPYVMISMLHGVSVFLLSLMMFGGDFARGMLPFVTLTLLFSFTCMVLGLFIAAIVKNELELLIGCWLFVFIPNVFFSGFVFPLRSMNSFLLPVAENLPGTLFVEAYRGILFKSAPFSVYGGYFMVLFVEGAVLLLLSLVLLKRNFFRK
jgi:ABC-2 type transport system permease protein